MKRLSFSLKLAFAGLMVAMAATLATVSAAERTAASLLPRSTVFFAELTNPAQTLETLLTHPLREPALAADAYQQALKSKEFRQLKSFVAVYEAEMDKKWDEILKEATGGGVFAAYDPETRGGVVLIRARDPAALKQVVEISLDIARGATALQGQNGEPAIKSVDYRGIQAHRVGPVRFAHADGWLITVSGDEIGKAVLDRFVGDTLPSLADQPAFQQAKAAAEKAKEKPAAWAFVDLETLRQAEGAKKIFEQKSDNPLAELLLGGVIDTLAQANHATAAVYFNHAKLAVQLSTPFSPQWISEKRQFMLGADGKGAAPPLLRTEQTIAAITLHRDIHKMWMAAPDLFNEKINADLAKADSDLTTLFAGRDFGDEILGALGPQMQLVIARQQFKAGAPQPAIKLPAFAIVARLNEPEKTPRQLKITFQSLVGFLNIVGAMNGQPPFELNQEKADGVDVVSAATVILDDGDEIDRTAISLNFSPALAFVGDRFVISSTKDLALELAKQSGGDQPAAADSGKTTNFEAMIDGARLRDILADNEQQLVAQNMLEQGHSREAAQQQIGLLLTALGWLKDATLELSTGDERLTLEFAVRTAPVKLDGGN